jgi:predicted nuclease with TOPRIM domain
MRNIKEIFERIQEQKREQREINKAVREALENSSEYHDVKEHIQRLRLKKMRMEDSARGDLDQKMDLLKLNIKEGIQVMSDVALTTIMKGESVKLTDSENNEYEPIFSVRFKKTSNKSYEERDKKSDE